MRNILLALFCLVVVVLALAALPNTQSKSTKVSSTSSPSDSHHMIRLGQWECVRWREQYSSRQQCETWGPSDCSAAAMAEVADYYGQRYRITDILRYEIQIGEITTDEGLLEDAGINNTMRHFGFKTSYGYSLSLDKVIRKANSGIPVIVSWPPSRYEGGHILVVTGGNDSYVFIADSSRWNRTSLTRSQFLRWWGDFSAIVVPS